VVKHAAIMFNPATSPGGGSYYMHLIDDAARSTTTKVTAMRVEDVAGMQSAIDSHAREPGAGLVILPDVFTTAHRALIIAAANQYKLPAIFAYRYMVAEGGLASYGVDVADLYRRAAVYADRILRGDNVAELPVQAPVKFELAINLKTAQKLGLTVSATLLATADAIVE
jgi:putative ABC transport system substrate-binding protein